MGFYKLYELASGIGGNVVSTHRTFAAAQANRNRLLRLEKRAGNAVSAYKFEIRMNGNPVRE